MILPVKQPKIWSQGMSLDLSTSESFIKTLDQMTSRGGVDQELAYSARPWL